MNVYLLTGLAGVGKSSYVEPEMLSKVRNLLVLSADYVRPEFFFSRNPNLLKGLPYKTIKDFSDNYQRYLESDVLKMHKDKGINLFDGISVLGFIKYHLLFSKEKDLLINTTAFNNVGSIINFERSEPGIKIKVAFIICSKVAQRERYIGRDPISQVTQSNTWKREIANLNLPNYQYFDLINCVPTEEQSKTPVFLKEQYIEKNAKKVVEYFLGKPTID